MDKSTILKTFNNHFEEFVEDVRAVFPDDAEIETAATALGRLRKANPRLIMLTFKECVAGPYRTQIESGDLGFFVNKDYSLDVDGSGQESVILAKVEALRTPVARMSEDSQGKVMKYMQNLVKLSDLYN
jgi:hypothetical protein